MIQYTNINEAWGIKNDSNEKETFKNFKLPKNERKIENLSNDHSLNNKSPCESFNHIFSCEKCLEKLKNTLNIEKQPKNILQTSIEGFSNKLRENKDLSVFLLISTITLVLILLVHSLRKPVEIRGMQKSFYVFPDDIEKIKALLENKNINSFPMK